MEALETKLPENVLTDRHDLYADAETDQPASCGGILTAGFGGVGAAGHPPLLPWLGCGGKASPWPPAGFNINPALQTGAKAASRLWVFLPRSTPSARLLPPGLNPALQTGVKAAGRLWALFPETHLQQDCCFQTRAEGFSVADHVSNFSPQTSFEEKQVCHKTGLPLNFKTDSKQAEGRT